MLLYVIAPYRSATAEYPIGHVLDLPEPEVRRLLADSPSSFSLINPADVAKPAEAAEPTDEADKAASEVITKPARTRTK